MGSSLGVLVCRLALGRLFARASARVGSGRRTGAGVGVAARLRVQIHRCTIRSARVDLAAVLQLILPVDDNGVARTQSLADGDRTSRIQRDRDGLNLHAAVFLREVNVSPLRSARDRRRRHNRDVPLRIYKQMHVHKLIWKQIVFLVAEDCLQLICAGCRIDLIVDRQQFAGGDFGCVVAIIGLDRQRPGSV